MSAKADVPFKGGFLLARADRETLQSLQDGQRVFGHWRERNVGGYHLHFDPMFPSGEAVQDDAGLVYLGYICDVVDPDTPEQTIGRLARAWALSRDAFVNRLGDCGGTYIVFAYRGDNVEVFLDATGTIGLCYAEAEGEVVAASHPNLLAELFGFRRSALADYWLNHAEIDHGGRYFPGLKTAFDEVRLLTPNTALALPSGVISRFYPRQEFRLRTVDDIVTAIIPALHRQIEWIAERAQLAVSLSGGIDTRVTLSALRPVATQCLFFTYTVWNNRIHRTDMEIATSLCARFGLRHLPIVVERRASPPATFHAMWERTHGDSLSNRDLNRAYAEHLSGRYVHIRSNILEATRGFYTKNPVNRKSEFRAFKLARLFRVATAREFTPYFQEFIDVTAFNEHSLKGFHYADLFYWEHRMGAWLSGTLRAARVDHFSYILYNCRTIIETLIARPLEERNSADVVLALIREMWPELLSVPIFSGSTFLSIAQGRGEEVDVAREDVATALADTQREAREHPTLAEIIPVGGVQTSLGKQMQHPGERHRQETILSYPWDGRVLDVGVGYGHVACQIALAYHPDLLVGIDLGMGHVKGTRKLARANDIGGFEVAAARGERLPFAARSFDRVHLGQVLDRVEHPEAVLREVARVLRPGGTALIGVPGHGKMPPGTFAGHLQDFTVAEMRQLIGEAGLEVVEHRTIKVRELYFVRPVAQPVRAAD